MKYTKTVVAPTAARAFSPIVCPTIIGVAGAAWATLISQALSAVISFVILLRTLTSFKTAKHVLYSGRMLRETGRIALPSIIQQATINLGMMLVQSVVNGYGSGVLAGYSASMRIDTIATVPLSTIGNAMSLIPHRISGQEKGKE